MKRLVISMCGAAALGLTALAGAANAAPLKVANPLAGSEAGTITEDVAWRRVCRPVWRGPYQVVRCNNVWVGPPRRGPGFYGPPPPRYGYYGGPPRPYYGPRYY